jgi:ATP-dependent Clp protease ATP-binding subunit ClpB
MQFDKFTVKSQEAIQQAQTLAEKNSNQEIVPEHLLQVFLSQVDGVVIPVLQKIGVDPAVLSSETGKLLSQGQRKRFWSGLCLSPSEKDP